MKNTWLVFLLGISLCSSSQTFTWMKGTNILFQAGLYGTQGVSSPTNNPGSRHGAATWVDQQGNLWLFGGEGYDNTTTLCWLNDLWKFNPQTNEWTWIRGNTSGNQPGIYGVQAVPSSSAQPGSREFPVSWTDAAGNFWLFGGDGFASTPTFGRLGDLWKYNPVSNQWTWMNGFTVVAQNGNYGTMGVASISNVPGARYAAGSWVDATGNLWMFGGRGFPATGFDGFLNDLWKYNPSSNQWTWMNGSNATGQNSVHGSLNVTSPANLPGGVEFPTSWTDGSTFYLFGGRGLPAAGGASYLNTLWKYSPTLNQWTWIGGSTAAMALGQYGTLSVPSVTNMPGARMSAAGWNDGSGNLWLFGGLGTATVAGVNDLNDMFCYNIASGNWTWVKGANFTQQTGNYGTMGLPAMSNIPGGRRYNIWWKRNNAEFWLFGGEGFASTNAFGNMEDLWKFTPSCNPESISATPGSTICSGGSVSLTTIANSTTGISWFNSPTGGTAIGSGTQITSPTLQAIAVNSVYTFYCENTGCVGYPRAQQSVTVSPSPTVVLSGNSPICSGGVYTCWTSGTAVSYTWNNGSNASTYSATLFSNTPIIVQSTGTNGCVGQSSVMAIVAPLPTVAITGSSLICKGSSTILNASGSANSFTWSTGSNSSSISVTPSNTAIYQLIGKDAWGCIDTAWHTVQVAPLPVVSISSKSIICSGEIAVLSASGAVSYSWSTGSVNYSISVSPTVTTIYSVTGTSSNSCLNSATFNLLVSKCLTVNEESVFFENRVYPNPSKGLLTVNSQFQNTRLIIINSLGQVVHTSTLLSTEEQIETNLPPGLYLFTLYADDRILKSGKLIFE